MSDGRRAGAARSLAKRALFATLRGSGVAAIARRRMRGRTLVLAYHGIVPDGESPAGERSLHLPQRRFAEQLDELRGTCDVVPLDAVLSDARVSRPRAAITFDDAYHGAVSAGAVELARRDLPATVFVAPGFVPGGRFWWDDLATAHAGELPERLRRTALEDCRGDDALVRRWAAASGLDAATPTPAFTRAASLQELADAAAAGRITFGAHTWRHPALPRLGPEALAEELARPLAWLREHFPERTLPWLAYPYGLESPAVRAAARDAGYVAALRVDGGWMRAGDDQLALPRLNVSAGMSLDAFALRLAGMLGR
jgi:peptidoglycan/xylan/chitin deacetylase (PgdA/CDA1 family)